MSRKITLDFLKTEAASGIILALAAALAIILANSPWSASYFGLIKHPLTFQVGDNTLTLYNAAKMGSVTFDISFSGASAMLLGVSGAFAALSLF